jgi:hypothetical protein
MYRPSNSVSSCTPKQVLVVLRMMLKNLNIHMRLLNQAASDRTDISVTNTISLKPRSRLREFIKNFDLVPEL